MTTQSLCKGSWPHKVGVFFLFIILCIGLDQNKRVCVGRWTEVCRLPKSLRSLVTHDTKLWKGMCTAPDAKRSDSSSTILPSHRIPAKKKDS